MSITISDHFIYIFTEEGAGGCIHVDEKQGASSWIVEPNRDNAQTETLNESQFSTLQWKLYDISQRHHDELAGIGAAVIAERNTLFDKINGVLNLHEDEAAVGGMMLTRMILNINRGVVSFMCDAKEQDGVLRGGFFGKSSPVILHLSLQQNESKGWNAIDIPEDFLGEFNQIGVAMVNLAEKLEASLLGSQPS